MTLFLFVCLAAFEKHAEWKRVCGITLHRECIHILHSSQEWLTDEIIAAAQFLMRRQYPSIGGLCPPAEYSTGTPYQFPSSNFVQILHISGNHWIALSDIMTGEFVGVYDSLGSERAKKCVDQFLEGTKWQFNNVKVQQQSGGNDCGLFAIAFATSLCHGEDPSQVFYDQKSMRQHLWQCINHEKISDFPKDR
jgi:hypothetical protein